MSIKEEINALLAKGSDEQKCELQKRAVRHMCCGDDEDGYNLYILWTVAEIRGRKLATDEGFAVRGRPRGSKLNVG